MFCAARSDGFVKKRGCGTGFRNLSVIAAEGVVVAMVNENSIGGASFGRESRMLRSFYFIFIQYLLWIYVLFLLVYPGRKVVHLAFRFYRLVRRRGETCFVHYDFGGCGAGGTWN